MATRTESVELYRLRRAHDLLLATTRDLTEAQISRSVAPTAPSIKFHIWHVARWSDSVQSRMPGMTAVLLRRLGRGVEIWASRGLAQSWGLAGQNLGESSTGMGLDDDASAALSLPNAETVRVYATETFALLERAFAAVSERQAALICTDWYDRQITVNGAMQNHLSHVYRHLGMIEALRGVLGLRGTATA